MAKEFSKLNTKELEVRETEVKKTVYSYDFIVNSIQELNDKLDFFTDLKKEADKLKLKR